jgi:hypothetical protein
VADMKMQLELARSMSYYATLKLNAPAAERRQAMATSARYRHACRTAPASLHDPQSCYLFPIARRARQTCAGGRFLIAPELPCTLAAT